MSGKAGLVIGLLVGVIIAVAASLTTMMLVSNDMQKRQAEAYDRGYDDATDGLPESGASLSADFNQGLMEEARQLNNAVDTARTRLQAFRSRDDLTPAAQEELAQIIDGLPE